MLQDNEITGKMKYGTSQIKSRAKQVDPPPKPTLEYKTAVTKNNHVYLSYNIIMQVNIALLTVTDTRTIETDKSGAILIKKINEQNHKVIDRKLVKDEKEKIKKILSQWIKKDNIDVIITTGGTGLTGRDITPEAIKDLADKEIPGFGELFRELSYKTVGTSAMQSRACAVLANGKYIFALPGSSGGVTDAWDGILKYQLDINHKPCNFVELFPRLKEKQFI